VLSTETMESALNVGLHTCHVYCNALAGTRRIANFKQWLLLCDSGVVPGSPLTSSVAPVVAAPNVQCFKSIDAPNGHFSHPIRSQVVIAGSIGGSNTALWEVPTELKLSWLYGRHVS
jgi:hypothetical protein